MDQGGETTRTEFKGVMQTSVRVGERFLALICKTRNKNVQLSGLGGLGGLGGLVVSIS
jgi:hypothetical protein